MTNRQTVKLILERWIAELSLKDRTMGNVANNFDELFGEWYHAGIPFDDAYALVNIAIKAHLPSAHTARSTYKSLKIKQKAFKPEKEFIDDWNQSIRDIGMQVFYNYFQIDGESAPKEKPSYGSMSTAEYLKQRRYADSHPLVNPDDVPEFEPIDEEGIFDDILIDEEEEKDCAVNLDEV